MIKVMQDKFGSQGNCMSAVMATMFQLPLEQVPYFIEGCLPGAEGDKLFNDRIDVFLKSIGFYIEYYEWTECMQGFIKYHPNNYFLVGGLSPRGYQHITIYKGDQPWHDPHPEGGFVIPQYIGILRRIKAD